MKKNGQGLSQEDQERYIDWVRAHGVVEAVRMQHEVEKNKKKFEKAKEKEDAGK